MEGKPVARSRSACTDRGLVCSAKGRNLQQQAICVKCTLDERSSIFLRDKLIFSSERILHKDYYRKSSVEKKILVVDLKGLDAKTNDWR
jgi:hypothetical protein